MTVRERLVLELTEFDEVSGYLVSPAAIKAAENINAGMQDDELPLIDADIIVGDQPQENAPEGAEGQVSMGV